MQLLIPDAGKCSFYYFYEFDILLKIILFILIEDNYFTIQLRFIYKQILFRKKTNSLGRACIL